MPEIIPLGWFHTVMGIIALLSGGFTLAKFKEISLQTLSGQIYLATTLITAGTALAIFPSRGRTDFPAFAAPTLVPNPGPSTVTQEQLLHSRARSLADVPFRTKIPAVHQQANISLRHGVVSVAQFGKLVLHSTAFLIFII
jgi:hypothetical protein